jgi:hypothetical protein
MLYSNNRVDYRQNKTVNEYVAEYVVNNKVSYERTRAVSNS